MRSTATPPTHANLNSTSLAFDNSTLSIAREPITKADGPRDGGAIGAPDQARLAPSSLLEAAATYAKASRSQNTLRAYECDLRAFRQFCAASGLPSLPAEPSTVAFYLTSLAQSGRKPSGIDRALAAISEAHKAAGLISPRTTAVVQQVRRGIRRTHGTAPTQKAPVMLTALAAMCAAFPDNLLGCRNRALLRLGFASALRRTELVSLAVADLAFTPEGLVITVRRSKTDQEAEGRQIAIPGAQGRTWIAVRAWLDASKLADGPLFRGINRHGRLTGHALAGTDVGRIVKQAALAIDLDPANFSGHSLRAGFATAAAKAGASERSIMRQTGHHSAQMVRRYIRSAEMFSDNAAGLLDL